MSRLFTIRIYKNAPALGISKEWLNEYHVETSAEADVSHLELDQARIDLQGYERSLHSKDVILTRAVISTAIENDVNAQEAVKSIGLGLPGLRPGLVDNVAVANLNIVLVVGFSGVTGRLARHTYRGVLMTNELSIGAAAIQARQQVLDELRNAATALANSNTGGRLRIATERGAEIRHRAVVSIAVIGASLRQRTAQRRARLSIDEDAMIKRLQVLVREMALIDASIRAKNAVEGLDLSKVESLTELIALLKGGALNFNPLGQQ